MLYGVYCKGCILEEEVFFFVKKYYCFGRLADGSIIIRVNKVTRIISEPVIRSSHVMLLQ